MSTTPSIQSLIQVHTAVLLQYYFQFHFQGLPPHLNELELKLKSEVSSDLSNATEAVAGDFLIPTVMQALHEVHRRLHTEDADKKQIGINFEPKINSEKKEVCDQ